MHWKKLGIALIGIVLLIAAFVVVGHTDSEENDLLQEGILVEDFTVNGEDEQLIIHENESVEITATVTNEGDDTVDVPLVVEWDDEIAKGHKGYVLEDLEPGETEDISWEKEEHATWMPNKYTVSIEGESVQVIVVEDLDISVEDLAVNGKSERVIVNENDPVEITATITNEGDDPVDVPLIVEWADEFAEGHKGYILEDLEPGETEDISWEKEEHATWIPEEYTIIVGKESVAVTVIEDLHITVENLTVNGESDEVIVDENEPVEVTATVTNQGDNPVDVPLIVEGAEDDVGHKGYILEDLEPDESEEVEWGRETHHTWLPDEYTIRIGDQYVIVSVLEELDLVVEDLTVNGQSDEITVGVDDPVEITATVTNQGEETVDVPLIVVGAEDDVGHKGYILEDLEPDQSELIEWGKEQHNTWAEGEYTIQIGEETVEVTVGEPVEDEEVDWEEIRIIVGLVIAAFIIGIGVGVLWTKKGQ